MSLGRLFVCMLVVASAAACKGKSAQPIKARTLTSGPASLWLDEGAPEKVTVTVMNPTLLPGELKRYEAALAEYFQVVGVVDTLPSRAKLSKPGKLTLEINPKALPAARPISTVRVILAEPSGNLTTIPSTSDATHVTIPVDTLGLYVYVVAKPGAELLGTPALVLRGASAMLRDPKCPDWIAPASPRVAALARDPAKFSIDDKQVIHLEPALPVSELDESQQNKTADEVLKRGGGDAINASVVYASLLAAKGYPVRILGGHATYKRGELTLKGFHQWAEAIVDGAPFYVETLDGPARLIPLPEARTSHELTVARTCGHYPAGVTDDPFQKFDTEPQ